MHISFFPYHSNIFGAPFNEVYTRLYGEVVQFGLLVKVQDPVFCCQLALNTIPLQRPCFVSGKVRLERIGTGYSIDVNKRRQSFPEPIGFRGVHQNIKDQLRIVLQIVPRSGRVNDCLNGAMCYFLPSHGAHPHRVHVLESSSPWSPDIS